MTTNQTTTAIPFSISIPDDQLEDLHQRLARTRLPALVPGNEPKGISPTEVRALVEQWRDGFDWRRVEESLNTVGQELVEMNGRMLHLVRERGGGGIPVVLVHGWPDSCFGLRRLVPLLTAVGHDVIVPSLPGFGFSDQLGTETSVESVATAIGLVLDRLGYHRYAVHGGDWGSAVAEQLALSFPDRVAGLHLLDVPFHHQFTIEPDDAVNDAEQAFLAAGRAWGDQAGYVSMQSTQPLTLAYGLADSPVGLLAWLAEKYMAWSDRAPDAEWVLTQASIYWFTNTIYSSMRLYAEGMGSWDDGGDWSIAEGDGPGSSPAGAPVDAVASDEWSASDWTSPICGAPVAFALHPADIGVPPRVFAERFFSDIRRWSLMPAGGHYAAQEEPAALAADMVAFLADL